MEDDRSLLIRAIKLAEDGIANGGGPFGAVIAVKGQILAEAVNRVVANSDPTAHAEVQAIREAASLLKSHDLKNCTLYCSCEPCPMCLGAIYWAGIGKVVYASDRHDAELAGFSDRYIYDEIILSPSDRHISFVRIENTGGEEVFKIWEKHENRITY
ncbi:MAG: nucleoside deaminase [Bacteroidetes bacterium]|nr:nucleoside deaminase [Bacteroidota bacterium]